MITDSVSSYSSGEYSPDTAVDNALKLLGGNKIRKEYYKIVFNNFLIIIFQKKTPVQFEGITFISI